jgi:[ribosomal protein S5]-alanine N-acetyltransferase
MLGFKKIDFRLISKPKKDLLVHTGILLIRPPHLQDYAQWSGLRAESRDFLQPWEPVWLQDDLTRPAFRQRIARYKRDIESDESYPFLIFRADDGALLGGLNLTQVRRGAASMATLGYWMGKPYAGHGFMTEAVRAVLQLAERELALRRIEAACVPENGASIRLLEKTGFVREGLARDYLLINGQWRDHLLFARVGAI